MHLQLKTWSTWVIFLAGVDLAMGFGKMDNACRNVNCDVICDLTNHNSYQPQKCDDCCDEQEMNPEPKALSSKELERLQAAVFDLTILTGVLLALIIVIVLVVIIIFLQHNKDVPKKFVLPMFFKKDVSGPETSKCNGIVQEPTIGRLANHQQSNSSPSARRVATISKSTLGNTDLEPQPGPFRTRNPSESTCPEEGSDIIPQGYDNFALSTSTINTSTLHNTSNSSTDTLGPALSTNTLHTTLPSENPNSEDLGGHQNTSV